MNTTYKKYWIILPVVISIICVLLIVIHTLTSQLRIDVVTIGLIAILILPWLLPFIGTIRLPGGPEITDNDVEKLEEIVKKSRILHIREVLPQFQPVRDDIHWSIVEYDPQLALASLRIDIEKILAELARSLNIEFGKLADYMAEKMLEALRSREIIGQREADSVREIIHYCNKAVHGGEIDKTNAKRILDLGDEALSYLDSLSGSRPR